MFVIGDCQKTILSFLKGENLRTKKKERKCDDLKCVRKPTKSRLSLTHHANVRMFLDGNEHIQDVTVASAGVEL